MENSILQRFQGGQEDTAPLASPPSLLGLRQKRKKKNPKSPAALTDAEDPSLIRSNMPTFPGKFGAGSGYGG